MKVDTETCLLSFLFLFIRINCFAYSKRCWRRLTARTPPASVRSGAAPATVPAAVSAPAPFQHTEGSCPPSIVYFRNHHIQLSSQVYTKKMMYHKDYVYQLKRTAPKENGVVCCFHRRDGEAAGCEIYAAERQGRLREKKEGGDSVALPSHECRQEIEKDIDIEKDIEKEKEFYSTLRCCMSDNECPTHHESDENAGAAAGGERHRAVKGGEDALAGPGTGIKKKSCRQSAGRSENVVRDIICCSCPSGRRCG